MNQKFNFVFCKHSKNDEYCYHICKKECPSVSNLWYKFKNSIVNFFINIRLGFVKCNQLPTQCDFVYKNKYCLLKGRHWSCNDIDEKGASNGI